MLIGAPFTLSLHLRFISSHHIGSMSAQTFFGQCLQPFSSHVFFDGLDHGQSALQRMKTFVLSLPTLPPLLPFPKGCNDSGPLPFRLLQHRPLAINPFFKTIFQPLNLSFLGIKAQLQLFAINRFTGKLAGLSLFRQHIRLNGLGSVLLPGYRADLINDFCRIRRLIKNGHFFQKVFTIHAKRLIARSHEETVHHQIGRAFIAVAEELGTGHEKERTDSLFLWIFQAVEECGPFFEYALKVFRTRRHVMGLLYRNLVPSKPPHITGFILTNKRMQLEQGFLRQ